MAKAKTIENASHANTRTSPEPPAVKSLDDRFAELNREISKIEHEIEQLLAGIPGTPARIAAAKAAYDRAFARADDASMQVARDEIRSLNIARDEAAAKLSELAIPLRALQDRQAALRLEALDVATEARAEQERVRRRVAESLTRLDAASGMGSKVSALIGHLAPYQAAAVTSEQAPATVPEEPPKKPQCPRCRSDRDVEQVGPGRWTCRRLHHGRLVFDATGQMVTGNQVEQLAGAGGIRTGY